MTDEPPRLPPPDVSRNRREQGRALFPVLLAALALVVLRRSTPLGELFAAIPLVGPSIPFFLLAVGTLIWRLRAGDRWEDFGLQRPRSVPRLLAWGLAGGLVSLLHPHVLTPLLTTLTLAPPQVSTLEVLEGNLPLLLILLPTMWVLNAFGEELLHRGFILTRLAWLWGDHRNAWLRALLVQAAFFGLGHASQGPSGILLTTVSAVVYGLVYWLSGRMLWAAVLAHGLKNSWAFWVSFLGAV